MVESGDQKPIFPLFQHSIFPIGAEPQALLYYYFSESTNKDFSVDAKCQPKQIR